jgi:glycerol-3-phosphate dehydrogenase (NAD(P)+)
VIAMVDKTAKKLGVLTQYVLESGAQYRWLGCEPGGALKTAMAIATGWGDGANAGDNRAALITREDPLN